MDNNDLSKFLARVPLFASIPENKLMTFVDKFDEEKYTKGTTIFSEGEPGDAMYIIKSGLVAVYGKDGDKEVFVTTLHRGDFFGEMALLSGQPRTATIRILLDAELYRLHKDAFADILKADPNVALYLSRLYAHRFSEANELTSNEPPPTFFAMLATHRGLGRRTFLYSLAYHLSTEAVRRVLIVELDGAETSLHADELGLRQSSCSVADIMEVLPAESRAIMERAWFRHDCGFQVFMMPDVKEREYWGNVENNLTLLMDLLRQQNDFVIFNIPLHMEGLGKRVLRLCDRALILINNQPRHISEVSAFIRNAAEIIGGRIDYVRVGVSHLIGDKGVPRQELSRNLGLPEPPPIWVPRKPFIQSQGIETDKEFPVRGARALARELSGVRVGLVLGAGGARGWAHLGVIKVLEEEKVPIDMIVGSSIGSMVGCLYAYSACINDTIELVKRTLPSKFQAKRKLFDYTIPLYGIIRGSKIRRMTGDAVNNADFLDLKIPAYVMAADFHTGESIVIDRGDVSEAVRASISLPGIMNSKYHQGRWLLDGGLLAPVPVDVAIRKGADSIVAVCVERGKKALPGKKSRPPGLMSVLSRTMNIVHAHATRDFAEKADVVLYPDVEDFAWDAFHRVPELIEAGEKACREKIDDILRLIENKQRAKGDEGKEC